MSGSAAALARAKELQAARDFAGAEQVCRDALGAEGALEPEKAQLENACGTAMAAAGRFDDAEVCYRRALALDDGLHAPHQNLGNIARRRGDLEQAAEHYEAALVRKDDATAARRSLAQVRLALGQATDALRHAKRCAEAAPNHTPTQALVSRAQAASDPELLPIEGGVWVAVPRTRDLMTPYVLYEQQDWFEPELSFVRQLIQPGDRCVDVGANYGVYALSMAKRAGPKGRVWAFEPTRATAAFLETSRQHGGFEQLTVVRTALSDREGEAVLVTRADAELNALDRPETADRVVASAPDAQRERVKLQTLDAWGDELTDISFFKLDAEGEESRIVAGGKTVLTREQPLLMVERMHADAVNVRLLQELLALDWSLFRLVPGLGKLRPFSLDEPADDFQLNVFACSRSRGEALERRGLLARDLVAEDDALRKLSEAHAERPTAARTLRLARACFEAGQRGRAVALLRQVERMSLDSLVDEEVEAPLPRYGALEGAGREPRWVRAATLEALVKWSAFSGYFQGPEALPWLEEHARLGFADPEMDRRLALARARD